MPYISHPLPIGPTATGEFLELVAANLNISNKKIKAYIKEQNNYYYKYVERIADAYNDLELQRYAVVVGDSNYAPALTKFLAEDLGWLPELTVITDPLDEDQQNRASVYLENSNPVIILI